VEEGSQSVGQPVARAVARSPVGCSGDHIIPAQNPPPFYPIIALTLPTSGIPSLFLFVSFNHPFCFFVSFLFLFFVFREIEVEQLRQMKTRCDRGFSEEEDNEAREEKKKKVSIQLP